MSDDPKQSREVDFTDIVRLQLQHPTATAEELLFMLTTQSSTK